MRQGLVCSSPVGNRSCAKRLPALPELNVLLTSGHVRRAYGLACANSGNSPLAALGETERARLAEPGTRLKTGIRRVLAAHALASGTWEVTPEGTRVWRMAIRSPGSRGMRVEFDNFSVGAGSVWVHDGAHVAGPYTGRGLYDDGHFWSGAAFSGSATVEYEPAANAPANSGAALLKSAPSPHQARTALDATAATKDPADYCELDATCYPDWQSTLSAVGQISFVDNGDEILCSGALVSTRDNSFKPYFLTAGHCVNNEAAARTVEVYRTYQTPACGGTPPTTRTTSLKSTVGAHLIGFGGMADGDFSLVPLKDASRGHHLRGLGLGGSAHFHGSNRHPSPLRFLEAHLVRMARR